MSSKAAEFVVNVQHGSGRKIVTVVDRGILGKRFEEGNRRLDLAAAFYRGTEQREEEVRRQAQNADVIHLVGKVSVALGQKESWIRKGNVLTVQRIPHAQVLRLG